MENIEYIKKIEYFINNIPKRIYTKYDEINFEGFFTYDKLKFTDAVNHERKSIPQGLEWGNKWEYGWFFTQITIPSALKGQRVVFTAELGECTIYVNGKIYGAIDKEHKYITLSYCAEGDEKFEIAMEVYAGHDGLKYTLDQRHAKYTYPEESVKEFPDDVLQRKVNNGTFGIYHDEIFSLLMDIKTLYDLRNNLDDNSLRKAKIDKALFDMCDVVDIELPICEFIQSAKKGRQILRPALSCKNGSSAPTIFAIGHSHLDLEWLWTRNETRRKAARTLGNQIKLIEEYPEYKYIQSQPWLLEVVKNEYPDLYMEVKRLVKSGNIIVEGGMWVEADTNIPSGESFIRQFLFGKNFIKKEFGTESEIFWLPDSFGMSATLPQIMKGCGMKYFMNAKVTWLYNGGDAFPHSNFMWKGIDGTEILSSIIQEYTVEMKPSKIFEKWNQNTEKADVPIRLVPYGYGDGGGGATREHLEYIRREEDLEGLPKVVSASPNVFFEELEKECEIKQKMVGELYYSAHRGSYTTQAKTKKYNRLSEFALREAELWSALLNSDTKEQTDILWKKVLFNQFHDIIPGTSITAVYETTEKEYEDVIYSANEITNNVISGIIQEDNDAITIFNSLSWDRKAYIEIKDRIVSIEGCETQISGNNTIALVDVPSCGFKSYKLKSVNGMTETMLSHVDSLILENNCIKAEFNEKGELISLINKQNNLEYVSLPSNKFKLYRDMPTVFDAWDIDSFYEKAEVEYVDNAEVKVEYIGELESCLIIKKKINNSYLIQRVVLRKDSNILEFNTEIDWQETHKLLKVDFDTNIHAEELVSEIQFGHIKRPNHKNRQHDADRFEVCQYKWSALCEGNRGFAVLNDCKYGVSSNYDKLSLTLLRSTIHPAVTADKGKQQFTYSVMPFNSDLASSQVVEAAYELNCPVKIYKGFAKEKTFISVSNRNIIVDGIKLAEDGSGDLILRLYEAKNCYTNSMIHIDLNIKKAYITDMLETNQQQLEVKNNKVNLSFRAFEIKTIRIVL